MSGSGFFSVDLPALTEFTEELTTQLHATTRQLTELAPLAEFVLPLGEFTEAHSLDQTHHAAVADMATLLAKAGEAIAFAEEVTNTVALAYRAHDDGLTADLSALGAALRPLPGSKPSTPDTGGEAA
ncbi:hypothetical protein [Goodfellowiella coeruleoviolacea]|uniref:Uncharacterized protein n=1 Tax=Goodfellowiella coeruleoviolacea TaxID=334858 RepID=A0AAE3GMT9_9PSEU|nr:hypothetical protein [Goodfellowiella coeruleoviolacea]MCP2170154.1 hypothetical protein [Goodfellowiella coeruleoviolacea]